MTLLEHLKYNSSSIHIKAKEEIDLLFDEIEATGQPVDNELDFYIRMSIQKVKLQLYYELKLGEYRQKKLVFKEHESDKSEGMPSENESAKKKTKKKPKRKKTSLEQYDEGAKGKTKEELIAINKARVAQYHPKPDLSRISPLLLQARQKVEKEKKEKEAMKRQYVSIISVPMGGMNKR